MFQPYVRAIHMKLNALIRLMAFESITKGCKNNTQVITVNQKSGKHAGICARKQTVPPALIDSN